MMEDAKLLESRIWEAIDPDACRDWDETEAWKIHEAASDARLQATLAVLSQITANCGTDIQELVLDGQTCIIESVYGVAPDSSPYVFDLATKLYKEREASGQA